MGKKVLPGGACCRQSVHLGHSDGVGSSLRQAYQREREDGKTVGRATGVTGHGGCYRRPYTAGWQMMSLKGTDSRLLWARFLKRMMTLRLFGG